MYFAYLADAYNVYVSKYIIWPFRRCKGCTDSQAKGLKGIACAKVYLFYPSPDYQSVSQLGFFVTVVVVWWMCKAVDCSSQIERTRFVSTEFNSSSMTRSVLTKSRKCTLTSIPTVLHRPDVGLRPKRLVAGKTCFTQTSTIWLHTCISRCLHRCCISCVYITFLGKNNAQHHHPVHLEFIINVHFCT